METQPKVETTGYRGKHFTVPELSAHGGYYFAGEPIAGLKVDKRSPILKALNKPFDFAEFKRQRRPLSLGILPDRMQHLISADLGAPRTLDLPIKFPGSNGRVPREFEQFVPLLQHIFNVEATLNPDCFDEYYCYLTVDQGWVKRGRLQREAPAHVDGFQGARWRPKVRANHTYTVANALPTAYYVQPFDFTGLDEEKHNYFWEMNRQIWETKGKYMWQPQPFELTMMDCYSVHRGVPGVKRLFRTFIRVSFEARIFDRKGNAHNPLFKYNWPMVPRDIEELNLVAYNTDCPWQLRVFPWQGEDGKPLKGKKRTQPPLMGAGQ